MRLRKIFLLANIIIIGLILWVGFTIYRTWASTRSGSFLESLRTSKQADKNLPPRKPMANMSAFQSVIKADVFKTNRSSAASPASSKIPAAVKETDLDLELKGTMIDDSGARFAVILDGKTREQQRYAENDFINGVRIVKILTDRVILERKGGQESLAMSYESGPAPVRRPPRRNIPRRKIVRTPAVRKNIRVKRRVGVKRLPVGEEGTGGP